MYKALKTYDFELFNKEYQDDENDNIQNQSSHFHSNTILNNINNFSITKKDNYHNDYTVVLRKVLDHNYTPKIDFHKVMFIFYKYHKDTKEYLN